MYTSLNLSILSLVAIINKLSPKLKILLLAVLLQIMGLVLALDINMVDYPYYLHHHLKVPAIWQLISDPSLFHLVYGEPIFVVLQIVSKSIGLDYQGFRIFFYSLMMLFNTLFLSKYYKNVFFILLWYVAFFYHNDGNIMRAAFSSTLAMLSLHYLGVKSFLMSFIYCVAAILMHYSAVILLFFYFSYLANLGKKAVILVLTFSLFVGLLGVSRLLLFRIGDLGNESFFILDKLYRYSVDYASEAAGVLRFITVIPLLIILTVVYKYKLVIKTKADITWLIVSSVALSSLLFFSDFRLFADRIFTLLGLSCGVLLVISFRAFTESSLVFYRLFWALLLLSFTVYKYHSYYWGFSF
jgi:hypothetical protein